MHTVPVKSLDTLGKETVYMKRENGEKDGETYRENKRSGERDEERKIEKEIWRDREN